MIDSFQQQMVEESYTPYRIKAPPLQAEEGGTHLNKLISKSNMHIDLHLFVRQDEQHRRTNLGGGRDPSDQPSLSGASTIWISMANTAAPKEGTLIT
jgi:hypothetical protein